MKKDIIGHVSRWLNCQQVKYQHQRLGGVTQRIRIVEWMGERITMNFVEGLSRILRKFDTI